MIWVNASIVLQLLAVLLQYTHLVLYEHYGHSKGAAENFGTLLGLIAELCVFCVFIFMGQGWTLTHSEFPHIDLHVPILLLVTFLHCAVILLCWALEPLTGHSEYEGFSVYGLGFLRMGLFAWFLVNILGLLNVQKGDLRRFLHKLLVVGSLCFLSSPMLILSSFSLPPYVRDRVIVFGRLSVQIIVYYWLTQLLDRKSEYYKVSVLGSGVLPTGKTHSY